MKGIQVWGAPLLSLLILLVFLAIWHAATRQEAGRQVVDAEYAKLVGAEAATGQKSAFPSPGDVGRKLWEHVTNPFYDNGPTQGHRIHSHFSRSWVFGGFLSPRGREPIVFSSACRRWCTGFDPFIQVLKPFRRCVMRSRSSL